jgi:hypothetical protein
MNVIALFIFIASDNIWAHSPSRSHFFFFSFPGCQTLSFPVCCSLSPNICNSCVLSPLLLPSVPRLTIFIPFAIPITSSQMGGNLADVQIHLFRLFLSRRLPLVSYRFRKRLRTEKANGVGRSDGGRERISK